MEPEAHRLDREQLLAEHRVVAARRRAEVDAAIAAAAEKRRAFLEWFESHLRIEARGDRDRERLWADMRIASETRGTAAGEPVVQQAQPQPSVEWEEPELDLVLPWAATG